MMADQVWVGSIGIDETVSLEVSKSYTEIPEGRLISDIDKR